MVSPFAPGKAYADVILYTSKPAQAATQLVVPRIRLQGIQRRIVCVVCVLLYFSMVEGGVRGCTIPAQPWGLQASTRARALTIPA